MQFFLMPDAVITNIKIVCKNILRFKCWEHLGNHLSYFTKSQFLQWSSSMAAYRSHVSCWFVFQRDTECWGVLTATRHCPCLCSIIRYVCSG